MSRVLVTGATGALGPATLRALAATGAALRVLTRSPDAPLPDSVERHLGHLGDRAALERAVHGVDAVVHLAALLHIIDPPPEMRDEYHRVNVDGTAALAEVAGQAGVRRFVLASTAAVYGPTAAPANESTAPAPDSWYAESKLGAERVALERHRPGHFEVCVLRVSAVYGPRIKGNYHRLLHGLASGRFVPIGRGANRRSLIHEDDVARAFAVAVAHAGASGRVFNVSDGTPHRLHDIIGAICRALGRAEPRLAVPVGPVRLAARMLEGACGIVGRTPPLRTATIDKYLEESVIDSTRIASELGFAARYDLDAGWRGTVESLRHAGALPPGRAR